MDRDNTIARLENIAKHAVHTAGEDTFILSLDDGLAIHEAIEALKAQLSHESTTSDLISRQAARHALCKAVHNGEDVPCENQTASCLWTGTRVCDFVREIDALPTVQPERKKGEWIDYTEDGYVECPFCHSATNCDGNKDELHFCFSCGADMRGEQDERG